MTPFDTPGNKPFENTVGKGEIASNEQFQFFPQCFLPVWITFCKLFQFGRVYNLPSGNGLSQSFHDMLSCRPTFFVESRVYLNAKEQVFLSAAK